MPEVSEVVLTWFLMMFTVLSISSFKWRTSILLLKYAQLGIVIWRVPRPTGTTSGLYLGDGNASRNSTVTESSRSGDTELNQSE